MGLRQKRSCAELDNISELQQKITADKQVTYINYNLTAEQMHW